MREDQTQLFKMEYGTRCDIFGCGEYGAYFVGRPDGPLNTCLVLCESCTETLKESVRLLTVGVTPISSAIEFEEDAMTLTEYNNSKGIKVEERIADAKSHATLDELVEELNLKAIIPNRENAKFQERKTIILAAHNASLEG